jgi:hypothetical protein
LAGAEVLTSAAEALIVVLAVAVTAAVWLYMVLVVGWCKTDNR